MYHKTWVIKLEGITQDAMQYIDPEISKIMGVWHIVPTRRTEEIGEWKILTDQSKCAYIHRQLSEQWSKIVANVPSTILATSPDNFSTPMISSKRARDYQDNESDNDSYGSLLTTGTDVSVMTADDTSFNEPPSEYSYPSYATAAMASNVSGEDTKISSPTVSTINEWQKEKQDLEEQLKQHALQIEKLQADLQAKISRSEDLEEKLAQAIDLAHARDARHEEMLRKFEQLMSIQMANTTTETTMIDRGGTMNQEEPNPSTPDRSQLPIDPPPPKKANTNSSPNRAIYALFRQTHVKQASKRPPGRNKNSSNKQATHQPMETDEENKMPLPEANSGRQEE